jgi:Zinc-ribbon, C4HC2 type
LYSARLQTVPCVSCQVLRHYFFNTSRTHAASLLFAVPKNMKPHPSQTVESGNSPLVNFASNEDVMAPTSNAQGGVFVLRAKRGSTAVQRSICEIRAQRKVICCHNAAACRAAGQIQKAEVWDLLSQMVDRQGGLEERLGGWTGVSMGKNLVRKFFKFYENRGDLQMLATMVCVLRRAHGEGDQDALDFLDECVDKYDNYIRQYSHLLYCWGLNFARAEIVKHLFRADPPESKMQIGSQSASETIGVRLRCGLCEQINRGLFLFCTKCGHGGHLDHLQTWFVSSRECPTGCGCNCVVPAIHASQS